MKKIKFILLIFLIFFPINKLLSDWLPVHFEQYEKVESIYCINKNNCFSLVNHPSLDFLESGFRIYESTDEGSIWELKYKVPDESVQDEPKVRFIRAGIFLNMDCYYIIPKNDAVILKMLDSGRTLKKIILDSVSSESSYLRNLAMYDTNYGFVANGYNYFTTTDGWETFKRHPKSDNYQTFYSPIFMDSNSVVMTSFVTPPLDTHNHLAFMKYHMKENKWDTLFYFESEFKKWGNNVTNLFFINDSVGYGCGDGVDFDLPSGNYYDIIYKTTDRGYHWELIHKKYQYPEIGLTNNIAFADEKNGIAVGFYGKIAMTNDGGDTWVYEPTPNEMDNCRKMLVCWAGHTPLIGTWDAGIFRYEGDFFKFPPEDTTGVGELGIRNYELRIIPNPAEDYIIFHSPLIEELDIRIYNVFGKCLLTIPNTQKPDTKIDVSSLPSGVYFVRYGSEFQKFIIVR